METDITNITQRYLYNFFLYLFRYYKSPAHCLLASRDSVVGITTGYWLDDGGSEFESRYNQEFSLLHVVHTGSGAHPASYPMGTGDSFLGGKAAGA
jgi:hypothetical protein